MPVMRARDRATTHVVCYAEVAPLDSYSAVFRELSDGWHETVGLTDRMVAELIRRDRIDVLLVTAARFDANRPLVAGFGPAPVQLSIFDGATTAVPGLDYWVSDPVLTPPGTTERFAETVVHLPSLIVYEPFEDAPPLTALPAARTGHITFAAFNNPAKIGDATIDLWARVLHALPHSRLRFKYHTRYADPTMRTHLSQGFGARGITSDRLDFVARLDGQRNHLAAYGDVDLALDTTPFGGATTTFDALWMGVPTVTLAGATTIGRMAAGMLTAVGLPSMIAATPDALAALACSLADDLPRLAALRAGLRDRVAASPLCDGPAYARSLEALCRTLWRRWCAARRDSRA